MHGNANIIVVMSDKQQPKNAFVREQIKDKPKNYKRMWVRLGESAACGGVFALAVCLVLLFMIPVLRQEEGSVPDTGAQDSQQASVEKAVAKIREKYGYGKLQRGIMLEDERLSSLVMARANRPVFLMLQAVRKTALPPQVQASHLMM